MSIRAVFFAICCLSMANQVSAQEARLTGQRIEGIKRVCVYGAAKDAPVRKIGSGEPCPHRYREPEAETNLVPAMALRVGEGRANGQTQCVYRFAGVDYRTIGPALSRCPLTPSATMRAVGAPSRNFGEPQN